ncbi:MAG: haloacid dehalogenase-like hydrolase, partial [Oscillospiraceae bacterium]|nr:haloacid dehalogenase-like hydrolase [Oscillospiraceae bacterium]
MKIKGMAAAFMMCISLAGCSASNADVTDVDCSSPAAAQSTYVKDAAELEHWTEGSESAASIREFVEQITDRESGHYVPPQDRIAVFDFDGTLYGERCPTFFERCMFVHRVLDDPTYDAPADMKAYAQELRTQMNEHRVSSDLEEQYDKYSTVVYEGMTIEEYQQYVRDFLEQPCTGFDDMTYGDGYFLPMVSLVKYLYSNNFKVYICSGSDRNTLRALTEGVLDKYIPPERCIGTDNMVSAPAQNGEDPAKYQYQAEDELVYGKTIAPRNMNTNKVISIQREIGKAPLMVFGNSEGDLSMAQMALQNKYGGQ